MKFVRIVRSPRSPWNTKIDGNCMEWEINLETCWFELGVNDDYNHVGYPRKYAGGEYMSNIMNLVAGRKATWWPVESIGGAYWQFNLGAWLISSLSSLSPPLSSFHSLPQGRRLRFVSGGDNYGERSEPKNFFARGGDNPPRNSKTNNAGIKVGGIDPPHPPGVGAYALPSKFYPCLFPALDAFHPCRVRHDLRVEWRLGVSARWKILIFRMTAGQF
jgi:hypothetical protein